MNAAPQLKALFVRLKFPRPMETFVVDEMLQWLRRGHDLRVLAESADLEQIQPRYEASPLLEKTIYNLDYYYNHPSEKINMDLIKGISELAASKISSFGTKSLAMLQAVHYQEPLFIPDVVICPHATHKSLVLADSIANRFKVPLMVFMRANDIYKNIDTLEIIPEKERKKNLKRKSIIQRANSVITINETNKEYIQKQWMREKDVYIYRLGVNSSHFSPPEIPINIAVPHFVFTGRFIPKKGGVDFLEALNRLKNRQIIFRASLIGDGPCEERYREVIQEYSLQKFVEIKKTMGHFELRDVLSKTTAFVLPSIVTADGSRDVEATTLKEAMAMQIPVITTRIPGNERFIDDGIDGFLVDQHDPEAIASVMQKIISNSSHAKNVGVNARSKIKQCYCIDEECDKLYSHFEQKIHRHYS